MRDPQPSADYRNAVLEPGGTKPAAQLLRDFLGRDVGLEAYARSWRRTGKEHYQLADASAAEAKLPDA